MAEETAAKKTEEAAKKTEELAKKAEESAKKTEELAKKMAEEQKKQAIAGNEQLQKPLEQPRQVISINEPLQNPSEQPQKQHSNVIESINVVSGAIQKIGVKAKQQLLQISEISIWLDVYDDIFSDFDPRPYSERALSDDFLAAAKKAVKEKKTGINEIKFLIPKNQRSLNAEALIRKRLREHFKRHQSLFETEVKTTQRKAILLIALGMGLMFLATFISTFEQAGLFQSFLIVLFEPTGWFVVWFGFEQLFYTTNQKKPDLDFYAKMAKCQIEFVPY